LVGPLWAVFPHPDDGNTYRLCGDPAYPQSVCIDGFGVQGQGLLEHGGILACRRSVKWWNTCMSKVCEVVEWGFKDI